MYEPEVFEAISAAAQAGFSMGVPTGAALLLAFQFAARWWRDRQ